MPNYALEIFCFNLPRMVEDLTLNFFTTFSNWFPGRSIKTFHDDGSGFLMIWIFFSISAPNLHVWALCFSRFHEYQNHDFFSTWSIKKFKHYLFLYSGCKEWKIRILIQSKKKFLKDVGAEKNDTTKVYHLWLEAIRKLLQMRGKGFLTFPQRLGINCISLQVQKCANQNIGFH